MIYIIEGPDGSGKTTLANTISKQTGYPIIHRTQPKSQEEKDAMMAEYLHIIKTGRNVIFDRCWYSEMVYGRVMRDKSYIDYPQMYALEKALTKHGALLIYCTGDKNILWQRATSRGEDYITSKETFVTICNEYNNVIKACPHFIPVVTYEYEDM